MSGYLSTKSASVYLDFPSPKAFDMWARRNAIPCEFIGRQRRYRRETLDRVIRLKTLQAQDAKDTGSSVTSFTRRSA